MSARDTKSDIEMSLLVDYQWNIGPDSEAVNACVAQETVVKNWVTRELTIYY